MSRKLTLTRDRILAGFMLLFEATVGETTHVLTNGVTVQFPLDERVQTLNVSIMNNPKLTSPAPLTIPAGDQDCAVFLTCRNVNGAAQWVLEWM